MMKRIILPILIAMATVSAYAQEAGKPFKAYLYNDEYEVFLRINLHDKDIKIAGQEVYGELPGYLGRKGNSFCWVIVDAETEGNHKARMTLINDFGSEDLEASLTLKNDSTYILKQETGSPLKIPKNGKWLKLPKTLTFKKK